MKTCCGLRASLAAAQWRTQKEKLRKIIHIQSMFHSAQFATKKGIGRAALIGTLLGIVLGIHLALFFLTDSNLVSQWASYIIFLSTFHLLEFFITAICNPGVVTSDSFLVNHSKAYTIANCFAATEFGLKYFVFPDFFEAWVFRAGVIMVLVSQFTRSMAMITCGESFNHLIQAHKKDTHILVTKGIYRYLRHPSYFGFHYWSIGTQLILNNVLSTILFSLASWHFFSRRIPYEERSLMQHFGKDYISYAKKARVLIPFIKSPISVHAKSS